MLLSALPLLAESDYTRFQQLIAELRHMSYEEWADDHRKAVAYRIPRNGYTEVTILPTDFEQWLQQTKQEAHMELLWVYAETKGSIGDKYRQHADRVARSNTGLGLFKT